MLIPLEENQVWSFRSEICMRSLIGVKMDGLLFSNGMNTKIPMTQFDIRH